ncbi:MAG: hypothetical protein ACLVI9_00260 [Anaerostipes hadrus]
MHFWSWEDSNLGKSFPEENTLSDIVLLWCGLFRQKINDGDIEVPVEKILSFQHSSLLQYQKNVKEDTVMAGLKHTER